MGLSLAETASALRSGELPLLGYLEELRADFDRREPGVMAFLPEEGRFERLRREAESLLSRYPDPEKRPPLFGIPVGVKDIFHADGFETRAGSRLPPSELQGREAASVTILRRAGALLMGKTVTTEFAYFAPGPTRNPHKPGHTPGGSSSGSAAAVAAGLCKVALGTQTIGSINRPAAFCGVVGFKPTFDRISRAGVIPLAPSVDHVGFFTPTAEDIALVAGLLCKGWEGLKDRGKPILGVPEGPYLGRASDEGMAHFRETCRRLSSAGFEVKSVSAMTDFDEIYQRHNSLVAAEAARVHRGWFAQYGHLYHPKTAELVQRGQRLGAGGLDRMPAGPGKLRDELAALMEEEEVDLWVSPAALGPAPAGLESTGDPVMNLPWTHAGIPTLSLPSGLNKMGLPMGLQVAGRWDDDEAVIAWAVRVESALRKIRMAFGPDL